MKVNLELPERKQKELEDKEKRALKSKYSKLKNFLLDLNYMFSRKSNLNLDRNSLLNIIEDLNKLDLGYDKFTTKLESKINQLFTMQKQIENEKRNILNEIQSFLRIR